MWAIDDADPDGQGIPGDMRYDFELSRQRFAQEKQIKAYLIVRALMAPFGWAVV